MYKLKGYYRTLKHNITYKENYYRNGLLIILSFILIDLIILYFIW